MRESIILWPHQKEGFRNRWGSSIAAEGPKQEDQDILEEIHKSDNQEWLIERNTHTHTRSGFILMYLMQKACSYILYKTYENRHALVFPIKCHCGFLWIEIIQDRQDYWTENCIMECCPNYRHRIFQTFTVVLSPLWGSNSWEGGHLGASLAALGFWRLWRLQVCGGLREVWQQLPDSVV